MSGWERAPGYGGGKPYGWQTLAAVAVLVLIVAGYWWLRQ